MSMRFQASLFEARFSWLAAGAALLGMVLLAALCRAVIDHPPMYDELLHMLAAQGVLESGEPRIADGYYWRAEWFTRLVALSYGLFGDNPVAARIPALVSAALLVGLVVLWTSSRAGLIAGTASGVFLAIMPLTVELSVFSRFYTLHGLAVFIAAVCVFEALNAPGLNRRLLVAGGLFIPAMLLARHLQFTTLIALGAIFVGVAGMLVYDKRQCVMSLLWTHPWRFAAGMVGVLVALLFLISKFGIADRMGYAPLWAAARVGNWNYFNQHLGRALPLLWPLFPLAAAAALLQHRRFAIFSLLLFGSAFLVHSLAGQKAARYLYYALPFMCILMGLGFSAAAEISQSALKANLNRYQLWSLPVVLGVAVVVLGLSQEGQLALRWLAAKPSSLDGLPSYSREASWDAGTVPELAAAAQTADRLIASAGVKALFYLDRYDYEINVSVVMGTDTGHEFGRDVRTGRAVIGQAESLAEVITRPGTTLVVVDDDKLGRWSGVPHEAVRVLEQRCRNLKLPAERLVHAWVCGSGS